MSSEFELIRRYFRSRPGHRPSRGTLLGIGDDAALLRPAAGMELAVSTDLLLEGRHFRRGAAPRKLGRKALAVNLSDMAAMGAAPRWATLALAMPAADERWLAEFSRGFFALARGFGVELIGGDTTRGARAICVTIFGEVPRGKALRRDGARAGDDIWVSGELGGAAFALLRSGDERAGKRLDQPEPRVELGLRLRGVASSAIDVSDGFAQDLGHILERSRVGAVVNYADLPKFPIRDPKLERRCVLSGGDDYELVFTAPRSARAKLKRLSRKHRIVQVGTIRRGKNLFIFDSKGGVMKVARGFDHFAK